MLNMLQRLALIIEKEREREKEREKKNATKT
jgi:hypothetical protein